MFPSYNPRYSVLAAGARARVLSTTTTAEGVALTRAVVTVDPDTGAAVMSGLNRLREQRSTVLHGAATSQPGQVCQIRRALIGAVLGQRHDAAGAVVDDLATAVAGLSDAQRRAVADQVGRLFDGTEDVLVDVALSDEYGGLRFAALANGWLAQAGDKELLGVIDEFDEDADSVLFEGLLSWLRTVDDDIDDACGSEWIDVEVNRSVLAAWLLRNRPHLADEVAEVLDLEDPNDGDGQGD